MGVNAYNKPTPKKVQSHFFGGENVFYEHNGHNSNFCVF